MSLMNDDEAAAPRPGCARALRELGEAMAKAKANAGR
jgi:hypothetical protein